LIANVIHSEHRDEDRGPLFNGSRHVCLTGRFIGRQAAAEAQAALGSMATGGWFSSRPLRLVEALRILFALALASPS
jgi:hypothetical protein